MIKVKAIKAKVPKTGIARLEFWKEMQSIGKDVVADFEAVTSGWNHKPKFIVKTSSANQTPSLEVSVQTDDDIFRYVDEGTSPHVIVPVKAKALHFFVGGDEVFSQLVLHPGNKARDYSKMIEKKWRGEFGKRMLAVMKKLAKQIG